MIFRCNRLSNPEIGDPSALNIQLKHIQRAIEPGENKIDELVYTLYVLSEEVVVEENAGRFPL